MKIIFPIGGVVGALALAAWFLDHDKPGLGTLFLAVAGIFFFGAIFIGKNR